MAGFLLKVRARSLNKLLARARAASDQDEIFELSAKIIELIATGDARGIDLRELITEHLDVPIT